MDKMQSCQNNSNPINTLFRTEYLQTIAAICFYHYLFIKGLNNWNENKLLQLPGPSYATYLKLETKNEKDI